jgi:hypothetical protein
VPEISDKMVALEALARLPHSQQAALVAAVRRGEVKGVGKRAALSGKRARALHDAVDTITCLVAVPEIERIIRSLEDARASSVQLANALKRRLEQTSFTRPPVVPAVVTLPPRLRWHDQHPASPAGVAEDSDSSSSASEDSDGSPWADSDSSPSDDQDRFNPVPEGQDFEEQRGEGQDPERRPYNPDDGLAPF